MRLAGLANSSVPGRRAREQCLVLLRCKRARVAVDSAVVASEDLADLAVVPEGLEEEAAADNAALEREEADVPDKSLARRSATGAGELRAFMDKLRLRSRTPLSMPSHSRLMVSTFRKRLTRKADLALSLVAR